EVQQRRAVGQRPRDLRQDETARHLLEQRRRQIRLLRDRLLLLLHRVHLFDLVRGLHVLALDGRVFQLDLPDRGSRERPGQTAQAGCGWRRSIPLSMPTAPARDRRTIGSPSCAGRLIARAMYWQTKRFRASPPPKMIRSSGTLGNVASW